MERSLCLFPCRLDDPVLLSKGLEGMQRWNGLAIRLNRSLEISVMKIIERLLIITLGRCNG